MDQKRFYIVVIFLFAFGSLAGLMFISQTLTGFSVGNLTLSTINNPPVWYAIPNQSWPQNSQLVITLGNYTSDPENYTLFYSSTNVLNISVSINGKNATFTPDANFTGNRTVILMAYDYVNTAYSSVVYLGVNSTVVPVNETTTTVYVNTGGGGGGTSYVYQTVPSNETEEVIKYIGEKECSSKDLFLKDYLVSDTAIVKSVGECYKIYLNEESFVYIDLINLEGNYVIAELENELGIVTSLILNLNEINYLDMDGDGLGEYSIVLDKFSAGKAEFTFNKVEKESFELFGLNWLGKYWWVIGIILILLLLIFLLLFYVL